MICRFRLGSHDAVTTLGLAKISLLTLLPKWSRRNTSRRSNGTRLFSGIPHVRKHVLVSHSQNEYDVDISYGNASNLFASTAFHQRCK